MSAYRISEVGFNKKEAIFFRTVIEMASEYDIAEWFFVNERIADVILVNADLEDSTSKFDIDKPIQADIRPILICCSSGGKICDPFPYKLKRPITYSMIVNLLLKLEPKLAAVAQAFPPLNEQHTKTSLEKQMASSLQAKGQACSSSVPITEDKQDYLIKRPINTPSNQNQETTDKLVLTSKEIFQRFKSIFNNTE
ncbi:MAG: hypothetical protein P8179_10775 [Candidatus Thiodiazotropha sp.]|jgi:hypothetical protein